MLTLRQRIDANLDTIKPRYACIVCDTPTRSDDFLCAACHKAASTSANKKPDPRKKE